jgi:hypothetical protein
MFVELGCGLFLTPLGVICRFEPETRLDCLAGVIKHSTPSGVGNLAAVSSINIQSLAGLQADFQRQVPEGIHHAIGQYTNETRTDRKRVASFGEAHPRA